MMNDVFVCLFRQWFAFLLNACHDVLFRFAAAGSYSSWSSCATSLVTPPGMFHKDYRCWIANPESMLLLAGASHSTPNAHSRLTNLNPLSRQ